MEKKIILTDLETALFCRGLALQLHAGIGLADGIYLLSQDETGGKRACFQQMAAGLDCGKMLSEVLEEVNCLPDYVCSMVQIGQETGKLEQTLQSLGDYYEQRSRQKRQIKQALAYPGMVFVLMLVVVSVLLVKVLPIFDGVYSSLGSRLTGIAAGLLHLGQLLKGAMPVLLTVLGVALVLAVLYWKVEAFRNYLNNWFRKHFGDRGIGRKFNNARFAQALSMGLSSGLTLEESLELAENLLKPIPAAAARCHACKEQLDAGDDLSDAMASAQLLPPAESRLLTVGLRAGNGDRIMEEIARRLSQQAEDAVEDTVSKVEPALVLIASLLVGLILLAVMLPLMNIMSAIG